MKSEGVIIGRWTGYDNKGNYGELYVEKEWQGKKKRYMLKVIGADRVANVEKDWQLCKGQEVKFTYGLSECSEYKGRMYPSTPLVFGINTAGEDSRAEPEQPPKQAEPHQVDDDDDGSDLPF